MIEFLILNYLKGEGFDAHMEMPKNTPSFPFVVIEKTGSSSEDHIETSTLAIQSYAGSLYEAALLNDRVKEAMANAVSLPDITKVIRNGDYNYTDESTKRYRYQAVFDIYHY